MNVSRIYLITILFTGCVGVASAQEERTSPYPSYFPDIPKVVAQFVMDRGNWDSIVVGVGKLRKPRELMTDRLDYLRFLLREGPVFDLQVTRDEETSLEASRRYDPIFRRLTELGAKLAEQKANDEDRAKLSQESLAEIKQILPPESISLLWQYEVFIDGPVNYFHRDDIAKELGLSKEQLVKIRKTGLKAVKTYGEQRELARIDMFLDSVRDLEDSRKRQAEQILGLRFKTISTLYGGLDEFQFPNVARVIVPPLDRGVADIRKPPYAYAEHYISTLYSAFADEGSTKIRNELPLLNDQDSNLKKEPLRVVHDAGTDATPAPVVLSRIAKAWSLSDHELSADQRRFFEEMMYGTSEVDGITFRPGTVLTNRPPRLTFRRLARKLRVFSPSLISEQKQVARDMMLLMFGPTRIMLSEYFAGKLELTEQEHNSLIDANIKAWSNYETKVWSLRQAAFESVLDVLNDKQWQQLENRFGVTSKELAIRYSVIMETFFKKDFMRN